MMIRKYKYSGVIAPYDELHQLKGVPVEGAPAGYEFAPTYVNIPGIGEVPQYAPTIFGTFTGYNPSQDCNGYYMSSMYQPNNNCYAYGTLIASNSFPQPGRINGYSFWNIPNWGGPEVQKGAELDGLLYVGTDISNLPEFQSSNPGLVGHFVALMISPADSSVLWTGDYHWARCDDNVNFNSWSQKDGNDQVTNFDFAGNPISDPSQSNWTVNQGPGADTNNPSDDVVVAYSFYCFMFVPSSGVNLI